jgi:TonB family protein
MIPQNKRKHYLCLAISVLLHTLLLSSVNFFPNQLQIVTESLPKMSITSITISETTPATQNNTNATKQAVNKIRHNKQHLLDELAELQEINLKDPVLFNTSTMPTDKQFKMPKLNNIARYKPKIDLKQPAVSSVSRIYKSYAPVKKLTIADSGLAHSKMTLEKSAYLVAENTNTALNYTHEDKLLRYNQSIRELINTNKVYPRIARKNMMEGVVRVDFLIAKNGELEKIKLASSSNYEILDQATIKTIYNAIPFPPFPEGINKDRLWMRVAVSFKLD